MVRVKLPRKKKNAEKGDSSGKTRSPPVVDSTTAGAQTSSTVSKTKRVERPSSEATPNVTNEEQNEQTDSVEPLPPIGLFFSHNYFSHKLKLSSCCDDVKIVPFLEEKLRREDLDWFYEHPSFKHIFHMPRLQNHRLQHLWFTLLRTVKKDKSHVAWFLVNGVPIRYSLKEHCLLSGMSCKRYPRNYGQSMGSTRFAISTFGRFVREGPNRITQDEVLEKFESLPHGPTKMKCAVLLFLCLVIEKSKTSGQINPFLIKAVDDLEACRTFPWGRYTFEDQLSNIWTAATHFKGRPGKTYQFPGFMHPLSMLVCEAIPSMKSLFRVVPEDTFDPACPRMCKTEWAPTSMKGWTLQELNDCLGENLEIHSTLTPTPEERPLLSGFSSKQDLDLFEDELTLNWNACIRAKKKMFFEEFFKLDVAGRADNLAVPQAMSLRESLTKMVEEGLGKMSLQVNEVCGAVENLRTRFRHIEICVNGLMAWRATQVPASEARFVDEEADEDAGGDAVAGEDEQEAGGDAVAGEDEQEAEDAEDEEEDDEDEDGEDEEEAGGDAVAGEDEEEAGGEEEDDEAEDAEEEDAEEEDDEAEDAAKDAVESEDESDREFNALMAGKGKGKEVVEKSPPKKKARGGKEVVEKSPPKKKARRG